MAIAQSEPPAGVDKVPAMGPVHEVVIDCADPSGLAAFWAQVLQTR